MASSTFSDPSTSEDNSEARGSFTIVINENGEIDYDPSALQDIIDSHQSLAPVTLVRLGPAQAAPAAPAPAPEGITTRRSTRSAAKFGGAQPNLGVEGDDEMSSVQVTVDSQELALVTQQANPILLLDQDQINRLENVLKSDEAKDILGEALDQSSAEFGTGLIDMLSSAPAVLDSVGLSEEDPAELSESKGAHSEETEESDASVSDGRRRRGAPQRRSQRQMEREMKEEAERIKKENQERMKKEREAAKKKPEMEAIEDEAVPPNPETKLEDVSLNVSADSVLPDQELSMGADLKMAEVVEDEVEKVKPVSLPVSPQKGKKAILIAPAAIVPVETTTARPKRQRKLPARMQNNDFEYGFGSALAVDPDNTSADEVKPEEKPAATRRRRGPPPNRKGGKKAKGLDTSQDEKEIKDEIEAEVPGAEGDDDEEMASDEDWDSEDDPERLWCICRQPHDNKFMISCDSCKEWFHGKCVGITKKMGQEMEETKTFWTCPSCKTGRVAKAEEAKMEVDEELEDEILEDETAGNDEKKNPESTSTSTSTGVIATTSVESPPVKKKRAKRASGGGRKKKEIEPEKKPKDKVCFECERPPMPNSIFCSENCIVKHSNRAKEILEQNRPKGSSAPKTLSKTDSTSLDGTKNHLLVMEPSTSTMLSGPNAPTEAGLEDWLKNHPTFHVVMPKAMPTYVKPQPKEKSGKMKPPLKPVSSNVVEDKKAAYEAAKNSALMDLKAARKHLEDAGESVTPKREYIKRSISTMSGGDKEVRKRARKMSESTRQKRDEHMTSPPSGSSQSSEKQIRANALKGIHEALNNRIKKSNDVKIDTDQLDKLSREIEDSMFSLYNRDNSTKYKNKYRSLIFNIKDEKNNGFFRKIVNRTIKPKDLIAMTPEEMASKELQQWRQSELKHDIEKIKSYELEMISLGSVYVMKSHKGEQVIEKDDLPDSTKPSTEVKLPDEIPANEGQEADHIEGPKTWEHGHHAELFESLCDVCTGKKTLDEFLLDKINRKRRKEEERRKREKERSRSKEGSSGSSHHRSHHHHSKSSSSRSRHHHSTSDRERSSKDKDRSTAASSSSHHKSSSKESSSGHKHSSDSHRRKSESKDGSSRHHSSHKDSSDRKKDSKSSSSSHHHHRRDDDKKKESRSKDSKEEKLSEKVKEVVEDKSTPIQSAKSQPESQSVIAVDEDYNPEIVIDDYPLPPSENVPLQTPSSVQEISPPDNDVAVSPDDYEFDDYAPASPNDDVINEFEMTSVRTTRPESEVTSTVTIQTPEQNAATESNPVVWKGEINMPDVAKFSVLATQVSGTTDYLTIDLKESLKIVGRISPDQVWDYISKIGESLTKEILLIQLNPSSNDQKSSYKEFYDYLKKRQRFGVIGISSSKMVKDCYIIPLAASESLNNCLMPLDGPGLSAVREDVLLSLIVRTRRKRPGDSERDNLRLIELATARSKAERQATPPLPPQQQRQADIKARKPSIDPSSIYTPTPVAVVNTDDDDYVPYDPASAGTAEDLESISSSDPEDIYDPESAFTDKTSTAKEKKKNRGKAKQVAAKVAPSSDLPAFSSGDSSSPPETHLENELARLTKKLEVHKRLLAGGSAKAKDKSEAESNDPSSVPGFKGLPAGIASILFGGAEGGSDTSSKADKSGNGNQVRDPRKRGTTLSQAEKSSSLSNMSDEDLLAKAEQQLRDIQKSEPAVTITAPPPFSTLPPVMPHFGPPPNFPPPAMKGMIPPPPPVLSMRPPGFAGPSWPPEGPPGGSWGRGGYDRRGVGDHSDRGRGDWHSGDRGWNRNSNRGDRYDDARHRGGGWSDRGEHRGQYRDEYSGGRGHDRRDQPHYAGKRRNGSHDDDRRGGGRSWDQPVPPGEPDF